MKTGEMCVKVLAVILMMGALTVSYGKEKFSAFAENRGARRTFLVNDVKRYDSAIAKTENMVLGKCKMSVMQRGFGDLPFLVNGIKYACYEEGDDLVFYNSNQMMRLCISANICVYFSYDCKIGEARLNEDECKILAKKAVNEAFSRAAVPRITECVTESDDDKTITFSVKTNITDDTNITVRIRKDTGSVILFDALLSDIAAIIQKHGSSDFCFSGD